MQNKMYFMFFSFWLLLLISTVVIFLLLLLFLKEYFRNNSKRFKKIFLSVSILSVYNGIIVAVIISMAFPKFSVISKDRTHCNRYYIGPMKSLNYKLYGKYIYNKSDLLLNHKKIIYGNGADTKQECYSIAPNTVVEVKSLPDYFFETPPASIRVKHGGIVERWLIY